MITTCAYWETVHSNARHQSNLSLDYYSLNQNRYTEIRLLNSVNHLRSARFDYWYRPLYLVTVNRLRSAGFAAFRWIPMREALWWLEMTAKVKCGYYHFNLKLSNISTVNRSKDKLTSYQNLTRKKRVSTNISALLYLPALFLFSDSFRQIVNLL